MPSGLKWSGIKRKNSIHSIFLSFCIRTAARLMRRKINMTSWVCHKVAPLIWVLVKILNPYINILLKAKKHLMAGVVNQKAARAHFHPLTTYGHTERHKAGINLYVFVNTLSSLIISAIFEWEIDTPLHLYSCFLISLVNNILKKWLALKQKRFLVNFYMWFLKIYTSMWDCSYLYVHSKNAHGNKYVKCRGAPMIAQKLTTTNWPQLTMSFINLYNIL